MDDVFTNDKHEDSNKNVEKKNNFRSGFGDNKIKEDSKDHSDNAENGKNDSHDRSGDDSPSRDIVFHRRFPRSEHYPSTKKESVSEKKIEPPHELKNTFDRFGDDQPSDNWDKIDNQKDNDAFDKNSFHKSESSGIDDIKPRIAPRAGSYNPPAIDPGLANMHQEVNMQLENLRESAQADAGDNEAEVLPVQEQVKIAGPNRFSFLKKPSKMYLLEFVIFVIGLSLTLATIIFMLQSVLLYFGDDKRSGLFGAYEYQISLYFMTLLVVVLPVSVIFSRRTRLKEIEDENVFRNKHRRLVLYLFLLVLTLMSIFGLATLIFETVDQLIAGGKFKDGATDPYWVKAVNHLVALIVYGATITYFVLRRASSRVKSTGVYFTLSLGLVAVVSSILVMIFPFNAQYDAYVDNFIENDIRSISTSIETYSTDKGELPDNLDALELSKETKKRSQAFGYSYETKSKNKYQLCANFKADTTKEDAPGVSDYFFGAGTSYDDGRANPSKHKSGRECFEYTVMSIYPEEFDQYNNFDNLFEQYDDSDKTQSSEL